MKKNFFLLKERFKRFVRVAPSSPRGVARVTIASPTYIYYASLGHYKKCHAGSPWLEATRGYTNYQKWNFVSPFFGDFAVFRQTKISFLGFCVTLIPYMVIRVTHRDGKIKSREITENHASGRTKFLENSALLEYL